MLNTIKKSVKYLLNKIDRPAVVLLYHRVIDLTLDPQQLAVSPDNFSEHLQVLKEKYCLLRIDEFTDAVVRKKKLPEKTVILTFDDGYADNFHHALPILESASGQALFYIATGYLNTNREFWWDNLERVFLTQHQLPPSLSITIMDTKYNFDTSTPEKALDIYGKLHPLIKNCPVSARDAAVLKLLEWAALPEVGRPSHRVLTNEELWQFAKSPSVVIGAHTHNHPKLSVLSREEQRDEITHSKNILETLLEKKIRHFSYPFGTKDDYNADTVEICRSLDFDIVAANYHRQVHSWHSRLEIPRMLVRNWNRSEFEFAMNTFFKF